MSLKFFDSKKGLLLYVGTISVSLGSRCCTTAAVLCPHPAQWQQDADSTQKHIHTLVCPCLVLRYEAGER